MMTISTFYPKDENGNKRKPTETFIPDSLLLENELDRSERELKDAEKDLKSFYQKELMDPKKGTVKTVKSQLDQIQYIKDRKVLLDKAEKEKDFKLPEGDSDIADDDYVKVVSDKVLDKQIDYLTDILKLNRLKEWVKGKFVYNPTEKDVINQMKRTMRFMLESDYDAEVATIGFYTNLRPANLYNVYNILNTISRDNAYITKCNRDFMIRLCKVIRTHYKKDRMYVNSLLRSISNIPVFYSMKNEVGIEESKELLMNLNVLYEDLYLKKNREEIVDKFGLKSKNK